MGRVDLDSNEERCRKDGNEIVNRGKETIPPTLEGNGAEKLIAEHVERDYSAHRQHYSGTYWSDRDHNSNLLG